MYVRVVLAGRRLPGRRPHLRPGSRALRQSHSRGQKQERPHRLGKTRAPAPLQSDPPSLRVPGSAAAAACYCRLVKGTVASAGKIKGLRGAKLGNPYLRWAFGEAAVIAKRDHHLVGPLSQRLEVQMNGNKFKANTVVAIKLARAVYFMLKNKTVFDPERLVASMQKCFSPGRRQPGRLTGCAKKATPPPAAEHDRCASSTPLCVGQASNPAALIGTCGQRLPEARAI